MARMIRWWIFLGLGFYLCGILTVLPLSNSLQWYRPQWLLLFFIFCQVAYPRQFNPVIAWMGGLLLDCLLGTQLGEHALVFAVVCYITALLRPRFLLRPLWNQVGKISLLVCLAQILILWFHALAGQNPHTLLYWMGTLTSCIIWPVFVKLLQGLGHMMSVAPVSPRSI
ncbi:MAG: rod shape-determining protein MreD [Gammaproteobacteria bacterium]|jgi:rod shape-determining protein MreD|nr:rod shape-determining protein MreD [Gammaproteobacteria bacterium]